MEQYYSLHLLINSYRIRVSFMSLISIKWRKSLFSFILSIWITEKRSSKSNHRISFSNLLRIIWLLLMEFLIFMLDSSMWVKFSHLQRLSLRNMCKTSAKLLSLISTNISVIKLSKRMSSNNFIKIHKRKLMEIIKIKRTLIINV